MDLTIEEPNPFTVFVGPNGSGKSNIFEAIEFFILGNRYHGSVIDLFSGSDSFFNRKNDLSNTYVGLKFDVDYFIEYEEHVPRKSSNGGYYPSVLDLSSINNIKSEDVKKLFSSNSSRLFIKNIEKQKINGSSSNWLNFSCSNLEKVLKRILSDETKREEIVEWLELFIPGFENIEIISSDLSGTDTLVIYEKGTKKPFTKDLLSDGTFNILALLTAVYQSDEPQFLCIEEPENGLHPEVIQELVKLFRAACEDKGHYIWLNTHSQTLVSQLKPEEIIFPQFPFFILRVRGKFSK